MPASTCQPTVERAKPSMVFKDPDPRQIWLNEVRLDIHLQQAGQGRPLKVRTLLDGMDWSRYEQHYKPGGRRPYAPRAILGLIVYGLMQGISSLRTLESFARTDLGCQWITGGIFPDHSVIGRFIQRHEAELTGKGFEQLTARVLQATGSGVESVAGDGTVIEAMASRFQLMKAEALEAAIAQQREALATHEQPEDSAEHRRLEQLEQAHQTLVERQNKRRAKGKKADHIQVNLQEPAAYLQPQKDKKRFATSYKPSVLANTQRIVVAQAVDPASECGVVDDLLEQAQQHGEIDTALFDAGYFSQSVIEAAEKRNIELLCPEGRSVGDDWNKTSSRYYAKSLFQYDPEQDCYYCPQGNRLTPREQYRGNEQHPGYTLYATAACGTCPHKGDCTRSAKGRRIKRYTVDDAKDALREKMQQPATRERYVKRQGMVEPVFGYLRYQQGFNRFRRKGLGGVRVEFSLHLMAYNLARAWAIGALLRFRTCILLRMRPLVA
jgi:transposase